jgi:hypothetical protein
MHSSKIASPGRYPGDQFIKLLPALGGAPVRGPAVAMVLDPCGHLVIKDLRGGDIENLRRIGNQRLGMAAFAAARAAGNQSQHRAPDVGA